LVKELISDKTKANHGVLPLEDPRNGEHLNLSYDDGIRARLGEHLGGPFK
jgi:hypothetical protein